MTPKAFKDKKPAGVSNNELENEIEQLLDSSSDAIRVINKDFTIRRINRSFAEMSEIKQSEVVNKKCWEIFPSAMCHTPECRLQRIIDGENNIQVEIERKKKDGTTIPCIATTAALTDKTGGLTGVVEQFRDVTERQQFLWQIQESEERYRALIELGTEAGEAIVMLQDIDGMTGAQTFISEQWPRITGYSKDELSKMSFFDLIKAEDRQASIERHQQKLAGMSIPGLYEMQIICKDNDIVPVEITGAPTKYKGQPANVAYIRDISERKTLINALMAEKEHYQLLFENVPIGIYESDYSKAKIIIDNLKSSGVTDFKKYFTDHPDVFQSCLYALKIIKVNQTLIEMMGSKTLAEYLDKIARILRLPSTRNGTKSVLCGFAQGLTCVVEENHANTFTGKQQYRRLLQCIAPGYEDSWGKVFVWVIDITDLKQAEAKLRKHSQQLEAQVVQRTGELVAINDALQTQIKQRIDFTRTLVHDLKTPLAPMLGASQLMLDNIQDAQLKRVAQNIYRGAQNLNNSINDLVDMTRGEVGRLQLEYNEIDIMRVLNEIVEFCSLEARRKKQQLIFKYPRSPLYICADELRLRQIMLNILENALKYTPAGSNIIVQCKKADTNITIEVRDNGYGINDDILPVLFEPYHPKCKNTGDHGGMGLGLPLARMLVELHKGQIWVKTRKNRGTTVGFSIPVNAGGRC